MIIPATDILCLACAALGLAQLAVARRWLRRLGEPSRPGWQPPVSVIVPVAALPEGWRENFESLLAQEYAGSAEFLFVADPGGPLEAWLAGRHRATLVPFSEKPSACSDKNLRLLAGARAAGPDAQVLVFCDADLRARPDWLRELVEPLADPAARASTTAMVYAPADTRLGSRLRLAWMLVGVPLFEWKGCLCGQSLALFRGDFEAWDVPALWSRTLVDDLSLHLRVPRSSVRFAPRAMPWSEEGVGLSALAAQTGRWLCGFRLYVPGVWLFGAAVVGLKALGLGWALLDPPARWRLLAIVLGFDALYLGTTFAAWRRLASAPFTRCAASPWGTAALAPLLQLLFLWGFLRSAWPRRVDWAGRRYRVRGPKDVRVL